MPNPVLVEVTRGGLIESRHAGAFAVVDATGRLIAAAGDIAVPVFPRSAVKAFQCLPVIESGAAEAFGFSDEEIALACASHGGEPEHIRVARTMLAKAGNGEELYECGAHWPGDLDAQHRMARAGEKPGAIHNNCSGKHAGMLALARRLGVAPTGYAGRDHAVQRIIARAIGEMCDGDLETAAWGIDGCSVPTWALPLTNLALGFARLASGEGPTEARRAACARILAAARAHPFMIAGSGRFCTRLMQAVPRAFVKTGAEGVFCGAIPHAGLGIALKCDDGASRAAEVLMAAVLARLAVWTAEETAAIEGFARTGLTNWRKLRVGEVRAVMSPDCR